MSARRATHAGSWYTDAGSELSRQLDRWLGAAELSHGPARAIIAPHAGYTYCGACSAFAYRQISPVVVKRIFILGPSHHVRLRGCALSVAKKYKTPLYDLKIDIQINTELEKTPQFSYKDQFTIVPILVGSLNPEQEAQYGSLLSTYFMDPTNLFVISSDFCHWGQRFSYTYYDRSCGQIHKSIEKLDKQGMDLIETLSPTAFTEYLRKYNNTICGRHPIGVMLGAVKALQDQGYDKMSFKFLQYAQSSQCLDMEDSSVSYASGSLVFEF
ncbi:GL23150 [Drosophila persimilis]|uniref:GL23150 n=1 Tax=Drosophila persimilis TaxID=7234 RepID=B4G5K3_DROPE|nr:GL23150 [Drosophila persimilis]